MKKKRNTSLLQKTLFVLNQNQIINQLTKINQIKRDGRRKLVAWTFLRHNILINRKERANEQKALEFKEFNLKIKAWTVFQKYFSPNETRFYSGSLLDLSVSLRSSMQPDFAIYDIAMHKRMTVLFTAFRYGIKERSRSIINKQKCYDHLYHKLL